MRINSAEKKILYTLSQKGYKLTPQRRAVLSVIIGSDEHLTPSAVYHRVRQAYPRIGLVTVYRTLEILATLGFIHKVHSGQDNCRSYTAKPLGHEHHLVCANCGTVVNFAGYDLDKIERKLSRQTGFEIESHLLEFIGRCQSCQKVALA